MTDRLKQNLYTKKPLRFGADRKFRILMLSDIQESLTYDPRTLTAMDKIVEAAKPDLVVLGGDNENGKKFETKEQFKAYLDIFAAPMESRKIPWAHVFGNHDYDPPVTAMEKQEVFESFEYCLSKHTGEGVDGISNFVLPVYCSDSEKIALNVWGLDSGHTMEELLTMHGGTSENACPPVRSVNTSKWDVVRFTQQMWYWESSCEIEKHNGSKPEGLLVVHIAPHEIQLIKDNPDVLGCKGEVCEGMKLGVFNSGLFSTVFQRGDIHTIASAHCHKNTIEGEYCGIRLCLDGAIGFSAYGKEESRGGRLFVYDEDGTSETSLFRAIDYLPEEMQRKNED